MTTSEATAVAAEVLACPACGGGLGFSAQSAQCRSCEARYPVEDGIPILVAEASRDGLGASALWTQARFFDAVPAEFEIRRPAGTPALYRWTIGEKYRRSVAGIESRIRGATALTVCGGSGLEAEYLVRDGATVIVADISIEAVKRARERARRGGYELITIVADAERLPIASGSIDLAYVHDGLHHLNSPQAALAEMTRVSRGAVSVSEPALAGATRLAIRLGVAEEDEDAGNHIHRFTLGELLAPLRAAGLRPIRAERYAVYYKHEPGRVMALLSRPRLLPLVVGAVRWFNRRLGRHGNKLTVVAERAGPPGGADQDVEPSVAVTLVQPGTAALDEIASGLQERGLLENYVTTFQLGGHGISEARLAHIPGPLGAKLRREAGRRHHPGLDGANVTSNLDLELLPLFVRRSGRLRSKVQQLVDHRNSRLGARGSRVLREHGDGEVVASDGPALASFQEAARLGMPRLLIQTIGRAEAAIEIFTEEARLHPEFAESLPFLDVGKSYVADRAAEQMLATHIAVGSEFAAQTLITYGVPAEKVTVIPYGADPSRFTPSRDRRPGARPRFLFVGGVSQRKGIKYLLEAARSLGLDPGELTVIGDLQCSPQALEPYRRHFTHLGHVPYGELAHQYQQADVFVYPSLFEGCAVAALEAMATGLPLITTENTGSVARSGKEGLIIPARDPDAIATAMQSFRDDRTAAPEMGHAARARAAGFTWQTHHDRLAALLAEMAAER